MRGSRADVGALGEALARPWQHGGGPFITRRNSYVWRPCGFVGRRRAPAGARPAGCDANKICCGMLISVRFTGATSRLRCSAADMPSGPENLRPPTPENLRPPTRRAFARSSESVGQPCPPWPGRRTMVSSRCSSAARGSVVRPVWTGDIWMTVLRGDTSQRKRPRGGSAPIGPAVGPPRADGGIVASAVCAAHRDRASGSSAEDARRRARSAPRGSRVHARQDHADIDLLAALDPRDDADDRVVVGVVSGHATPPRRKAAAARADPADSARRPHARADGSDAAVVGAATVGNRADDRRR